MISAYYTFHVYIMHHFRGEEKLHRGWFKGYIIISQECWFIHEFCKTVSGHLSWTVTSPCNVKAVSKGTLESTEIHNLVITFFFPNTKLSGSLHHWLHAKMFQVQTV